MKNRRVYSLGHSNMGLDNFIKILKKLKIKYLLDVRSVPKSFYVPHFNRELLETKLKENDISYTFCGESIGGRQGIEFKDYVNSFEYKSAIKKVERIIYNGGCAIMCSEKDFTRCHRRYICNTLIEDGFEVIQVDVNNNLNLVDHQLSLGE